MSIFDVCVSVYVSHSLPRVPFTNGLALGILGRNVQVFLLDLDLGTHGDFRPVLSIVHGRTLHLGVASNLANFTRISEARQHALIILDSDLL